jgi:hypothetical protein
MINDIFFYVPLCCGMSAYYSPSDATCVVVITRCPVRFIPFGLLLRTSFVSVCVRLQFCIGHAITTIILCRVLKCICAGLSNYRYAP